MRTLLALLGVCALAWLVLSALARRGIGVGARGARVRVLERIALSPRRQLYLVQVDGRELLLGAGESGAPTLIAELGGTHDRGHGAATEVVEHGGAKPIARIEG